MDEDTMISFVGRCRSYALRSVLSQAMKVTVTEKVVMRLIESLRKDGLIDKDRWRTSDRERTFDTLLEKCPDLSYDQIRELKWRFYDAVSEWYWGLTGI